MADELTRAGGWLNKVEDTARILTIVSMTGLVFYQVAARIIFKWSSPALEEAARFIMIWSIFIIAVVTSREDGHIQMGGIFRSGAGRRLFEAASKIITLAFLIVFIVWSYRFAAYSLEKDMNSIVLGVPLIVVHACFFVTGLLMAFHTLIHLIDRLKKVIAYFNGGAR